MIQQTSLEAYKSVLNDLGDRQRIVYYTLSKFEYASNLDLSRYLRVPINQITPRVYELRNMKLVGFCCYKVDRITKRKVMCWKVLYKDE